MEINDITGEIVRASMRVHSALGPGLLEATYRVCVCHELASRGLSVEQERALPVVYRLRLLKFSVDPRHT
jgi:GxxExxY protein